MQKSRMTTTLERLFKRGWLESYQAWLMYLTHRWPSIPWRSARVQVYFYEHAMSYWLVHGKTRIPISRGEAVENGLPWVLHLPASRVLKRSLSLPAVKRADLSAVLGHEVSRHTPYQQEAVSFTWRQQQGQAKDTGDIDIWVLPLTAWQQLIIDLPELSARCKQVDVELVEGGSEGINLLPKTDQARLLAPRVKVACVLLAITLIIGWWGMHRTVHNRETDVAQWQEKIAVLETEVRPIRQLQANVRRQEQMQQFVAGLNRSMPAKLALLAQLSQCIPTDTVLNRVAIQGRTLSIDGMATSPEALVPAMACATQFSSPSLVGTLQLESQNNKQRFSLTAQVQGHAP